MQEFTIEKLTDYMVEKSYNFTPEQQVSYWNNYCKATNREKDMIRKVSFPFTTDEYMRTLESGTMVSLCEELVYEYMSMDDMAGYLFDNPTPETFKMLGFDKAEFLDYLAKH